MFESHIKSIKFKLKLENIQVYNNYSILFLTLIILWIEKNQLSHLNEIQNKTLLSLVLEREKLWIINPSRFLSEVFSSTSCSLSGEEGKALHFPFSPSPSVFFHVSLLVCRDFLCFFLFSCVAAPPIAFSHYRHCSAMPSAIHNLSSIIAPPNPSSTALAADPGCCLGYRSGFLKTQSTISCRFCGQLRLSTFLSGFPVSRCRPLILYHQPHAGACIPRATRSCPSASHQLVQLLCVVVLLL